LTLLLLDDPWRADVLRALNATEPRAWVTGGFVRNRIWDQLEPKRPSTILDDVDVVLFQRHREDEIERMLLAQLKAAVPSVPWSVRNQARMHERSGDQPYADLEAAIRSFPDTASAIAVQLRNTDRLAILAPFGLADAFAGVVRPTPLARKKPRRYVERLERKEAEWRRLWPMLRIETAPL
jgi:hypothetical protein